MTEPKLKAHVAVSAGLRRADREGLFAAVVYRGDRDAGTLLVKVNHLDGNAVLYGQARDGDGRLGWRPFAGPAPEARIDAAAERERRLDPDAWLIEVEDRAGRNPFDDTPAGPCLDGGALFSF